MLLTFITFLIILSILVLVHELGHFLVAKKLGIKVEEFGFGLPPRLWGIKKGETVYSLNSMPIGG
ncbi:MAG: RIP metalloprotease RseP, partial [Candidatus Omnitrophica bacterium]|nr:RIP metalloprotease RseP [Candidatus Omnitrophota bacterium]